MSDLLFPLLLGVGWGTTIMPHHFFSKQVARSGREVRVQHGSQPVTKIKICYYDDGFLSQAPGADPGDGSVAYSDFDTMLGFFNYHGGGFQSFLFQGVNQRERAHYMRQGELQFKGDGGTASFQLVRNRGIWAEAIYWPVNPDGIRERCGAGPRQITALGNGAFQLAAAPAIGALVTADFTFAYRCTFDCEEMEFKLDRWLLERGDAPDHR